MTRKLRDGFRKRVSKSGVVSHQIRLFTGRGAHGRPEYYVETVKGGIREAKARRSELVAEHRKRKLVRTKVTVAEHMRARIDQWETAGTLTAKTAERYRQLCEHQIVPHLGRKIVRDLQPIDIEQWHTALRTNGRKDGGGVTARTIGHAHRILSKGLRDAVRHNLAAANAAGPDGERPPKINAVEVIIVAQERIAEMVEKLRGRTIYSRAIIALFTGARRGEILALKWSNVDLDKKEMRIREALEETKTHGVRFKPAKTKAGRRDISLPDIVVEALHDHRRHQLELRMALGLGKMPKDALVFHTLDGGPQSPLRFTMDWTREADRIGMGDVTLHALRHTHASMLIDAGVDVVTIAKRLGHATPNITLQVYAHLFRKRDDKASDAINAAVAGYGARTQGE